VILPAVLAVVVAAQFVPPAKPLAAPPGGGGPAGPKRFFDSLLGRQPPTPQFIPAPTPPTAAEVEASLRLAAVPKLTAEPHQTAVPQPAAKTAGTAAAASNKHLKKGAAAPKAKSVGQGKTAAAAGKQPVVADPQQPAAVVPKPAPARLPTWSETVTFATALQGSAQLVATNAVNPNFKPARAAPAAAKAPAARADKLTANAGGNGRPTGSPPPRTRRLENLRLRIAQTLAAYQRRPLNTAQHTPWEVMHGFIAFGIPTRVRVGGPAGDAVNAIGWMNMGGRCRGQVMLAASGDRLTAMRGVGVQGHSAQYLAILAQCRVAMNSPITIQSKSFTVADLVEEEKLSCKAGTELTFALIALAHYLPTDSEWKSRDGKSWSLAKLAAEEIEQPIRGAPCGGTHRLFGLAYGCQRRLRATGQLDGVYLRADKFVRDYQTFTLTKLQNPDGSFSTEWFKYPADRADDVDRKVQTTGHILEWLVASLDQESLYQPRVLAAVEFLTQALAREPSREWKIGPMGHALHALTIYQERVWGVVLPGGIAAFHGPMKAAASPAQLADRPDEGSRGDAGADAKTTRR
jgi:hypothetical protein